MAMRSVALLIKAMVVLKVISGSSAENRQAGSTGIALTSDEQTSGGRRSGVSASSTSSLSDLLYDSWLCDFDVVSETAFVSAPNDGEGRLLEIHVRSNVKVSRFYDDIKRNSVDAYRLRHHSNLKRMFVLCRMLDSTPNRVEPSSARCCDHFLETNRARIERSNGTPAHRLSRLKELSFV